MFFGDVFGKYFGYIEAFLTSEVDVRIVRGTFIPCKTCHWYTQCVVPKGKMLGKFKEYYGNNNIMYHDNYHQLNRTNTAVYHCLEYTTIRDPKGEITIPQGGY